MFVGCVVLTHIYIYMSVCVWFLAYTYKVLDVMFVACTLSLISFWSLANLVLHRTVERIHVGKKFGDIPRGIFIIRGENVVLLGEVVSCLLVTVVLLYDELSVYKCLI